MLGRARTRRGTLLRWVRGTMLLLLLAPAATAQDRLKGERPSVDLQSWRFWWEFNRESHAFFRPMSPPPALPPEEREAVRKALLSRAIRGDQESRTRGRGGIQEGSLGDVPRIRAAAIVALGRLGDDRDIRPFLQMLDNIDERMIVKDACAVALLARGEVRDKAQHDDLREKLVFWLENDRAFFADDAGPTVRHVQPSITHALLVATAGHHARTDPLLLASLGGAVQRPPTPTVQFAEGLLLACGLAESPILLPELKAGAGGGPFADERSLSDASRSMALYALARCGAPAAPHLERRLADPRAGIESRRAAALGLGRLLRDAPLGDDVGRELVAALRSKGEPVVAGFAALALGAAQPPLAIDELWRTLDDSPDAARRPYVALALGFATRAVSLGERDAARRRLVDALEREREAETEAALCLACGLAGAPARGPLLRRAKRGSEVPLRSAAIQGLGLLGESDERTREVLRETLRSSEPALVEDAALALHQAGDRVEARLVALLRDATGSSTRDDLRVGCMRAVARLRVTDAAPDLRRILGDASLDLRVREGAAVALGFVGSAEPGDLLLDVLSDYNFYAPTEATKQIIWLGGSFATITQPDGGPK